MQLCIARQQFAKKEEEEKIAAVCPLSTGGKTATDAPFHSKKGRQILWFRRRILGTKAGPKHGA